MEGFEKARLEKAMKRIKENSFYGLGMDREEMKKYYESAEFNHAFDKAMERYCENDVKETCRTFRRIFYSNNMLKRHHMPMRRGER